MLSSLASDRRPRYWLGFLAVGSVVLVGYSIVSLPPAWYVPVNLVTSAVVLAVALRAVLDRRDLGLEGGRGAAGLRWGLAAALAAAVVLAAGMAIPVTRPLFDDARTSGIGVGLLAYRALVRIPFGTVVLEELAFRGVLLGAARRVSSDLMAALGSSLVFGLWHIRPALDLLAANDIASGTPEKVVAVAGAVLGTILAGLFFCWLRVRSDSLVAPLVAHTATNSLATVGAFVV